jgi:hypothetical protein
MPDVTRHIPPANEWAESGIPILVEAIAAIEDLVKTQAFQDGPPVYREEWAFIYKRLWRDGGIRYEGIEEIGHHHYQRVACAARGQELHSSIVNDASLPPWVRAKFRSCAGFASGAWCSITSINEHTRLDDGAFIVSIQHRLSLPISPVNYLTRCRGTGSLCKQYRSEHLPTVPGYLREIGRFRSRWYGIDEHSNATHWFSCTCGGVATAGHNAAGDAYGRLIRPLGYSVTVKEVYAGRSKPTPKHPEGEHQWIDGVMQNMRIGDGRAIGFDCAITNGIAASCVEKAATKDGHATSEKEKQKIREKAFACGKRGLNFIPVALDSFSRLGNIATKIVVEGYKAMIEKAKTDQEKWEIINMKKSGLAKLSATVQRRNAAMLFSNADPISGGVEARPPPFSGHDEHEPMA